MKDNKGFTIIEVVVVIALIAAMGGIFTLNMTKDLSQSQADKKTTENNQITLAAETYMYMHKDNPDPKYSEVNSVFTGGTNSSTTITAAELKRAGLISGNVNFTGKVVVKKQADGTFKCTIQ